MKRVAGLGVFFFSSRRRHTRFDCVEFRRVLFRSDSLASMFVNQKQIPNPQSFMCQLENGVKNAELRARKIPTEQDIMRALQAWQPHPDLSPQIGRASCRERV